jgi:hypothetical protein
MMSRVCRSRSRHLKKHYNFKIRPGSAKFTRDRGKPSTRIKLFPPSPLWTPEKNALLKLIGRKTMRKQERIGPASSVRSARTIGTLVRLIAI